MPVLPQDRFLLRLVQGAPELLFLVLDLGEDVVGQLVGDVVLLVGREMTFDGGDLPIDEVHLSAPTRSG